MNGMVVLRVALVLFLVGAIAKIEARLDAKAIADARMDLISSVTRPFNAFTIFNSKASNEEACCDLCWCTKSIPPQCRCSDITEDQCRAGCKNCLCNYSLPGQCHCRDITDSCPPTCSN